MANERYRRVSSNWGDFENVSCYCVVTKMNNTDGCAAHTLQTNSQASHHRTRNILFMQYSHSCTSAHRNCVRKKLSWRYKQTCKTRQPTTSLYALVHAMPLVARSTLKIAKFRKLAEARKLYLIAASLKFSTGIGKWTSSGVRTAIKLDERVVEVLECKKKRSYS